MTSNKLILKIGRGSKTKSTQSQATPKIEASNTPKNPAPRRIIKAISTPDKNNPKNQRLSAVEDKGMFVSIWNLNPNNILLSMM